MTMRYPSHTQAAVTAMTSPMPRNGAGLGALRPPPGLEEIASLYPAPGVWLWESQKEPPMPPMRLQQPQQPKAPQPSVACRATVTELLLSIQSNMEVQKRLHQESTMKKKVADPFARRATYDYPTQLADTAEYGQPQADALQRHARAPYVETCSTFAALPSMEATNSCSWTSEASVSEASDLDVGCTTLMVRNIPSAYTQETLLREWPIDGTWDLLYVPWNAKEGCNLGYAFVNFHSRALAAAFRAKWQNQYLSAFPCEDCLDIKPADVQGFAANIAQLKKKRVHRIKIRQCLPVVVQNGRRVDVKNL